MEEGKCRLLSGLLGVKDEFESRELLGSDSTVDPACRDGGEGDPGRVGEHEAAGRCEGGCGCAGRDEERLGHGHADQADGEGDSE